MWAQFKQFRAAQQTQPPTDPSKFGVDYTEQGVEGHDDVILNTRQLEEDCTMAYTAIPLKLVGTPEEVNELMAEAIKVIADAFEDIDGIDFARGGEILTALSITLETTIGIMERQEAERAARQ